MNDPSKLWSLLKRGVLGGMANLCATYTISVLPLGVANCLMFTMPIFVSLVSQPRMLELLILQNRMRDSLHFRLPNSGVLGFLYCSYFPLTLGRINKCTTQKVTALSWLRFGRRPSLLDALLLFGCTVGTVLATEVWSVPDSADREIVGLVTGILVAILNADAVLVVTTELQVSMKVARYLG